MKTITFVRSLLIICCLITLPFGCTKPFGSHSLIEIKNPNLEWNFKNYDFGQLPVGSTVKQTFEIANTGNDIAKDCGPVQITDTVNFSITQDSCNQSDMKPGDVCSVEISTHPTTTGEKTLQIQRECKDNYTILSPKNEIKVVAVFPNLQWDIAAHDFGSVGINTDSSTQVFTLSNAGETAATGCGLPSISNATDFVITSDTCGVLDLGVNQTCEVSVKAHPGSIGLKAATLSRTCSLGGVVSTDLDGLNVEGESKITDLSWTPLEYDFGDVEIGQNKGQSIVCHKGGGCSVVGVRFTLENQSKDQEVLGCSAPTISDTVNFSISSDSCSGNDLMPSESCEVRIVANPKSLGEKTATLQRECLSDGVVATTSQMITVNGITPAPNLSWNNNSHDFGMVNLSEISRPTFYFSLSNKGSVSATGCSTVSLSNNVDFSILEDDCGSSDLPSGQSCNIAIQANPVTFGIKTTNLSRSCSVGGIVSTNRDEIIANGYFNADWKAEFNVTDFKNLKLGTSSNTFSYYFRNINAINLTSCTAPVLSDNVNFTITEDQCGTNNVSASSLCEVKIKANLVSVGTSTTTLSRTCQESGETTLSLQASAYSNTITVQKISASMNNTCALLSNKTVNCWGQGVGSNIGKGAFPTSGPNDLMAYQVESVEAGGQHICVLLSDQTVRCWGYNENGQLGDGSTTRTYYNSVPVAGLSQVTQLSTGGRHTCAVLADQTVKCWGLNDYGQLGDGTTTQRNSPVSVVGLSNVKEVYSGMNHNCAILLDETVKCWGNNNYGKIGDGTTINRSAPVVVAGLSNVKQLALGVTHTCAKIADQTVKCWGSNEYGQLGDGSTTSSLTPLLTQNLSGVIMISADKGSWGNTASNFTCATLSDQTVKCWGRNEYGQLGDGTLVNSLSPIQSTVVGVQNILSISSGGNYSCILLSNREVKCWGDNSVGQLGDGRLVYNTTVVKVPNSSNATSVSMGEAHTCMLLVDKTVKCWGINDSGQLGDGTTYTRVNPVLVSGLNNVTQIIAGAYHNCALLSDKTVKCWGRNEYGQLGDGTYTNKFIPTAVVGINDAEQISVNGQLSCALLSNQTIKCWGRSDLGQLGNGATSGGQIPVQVSGIANAVQVVAGGGNGCALLSDSTVKCWGYNWYGAIGDGTTINRLTPVLIGLTGVSQLSAGSAHICALLSDKTVKCWGYNSVGQIGDDTLINKLEPTLVTNLDSVEHIRATAFGVCAMQTDQRVKCWGHNYFSQLGNAERSERQKSFNLLLSKKTSSLGSGYGYRHMCTIGNTPENLGVICYGDNLNFQTGHNELYLKKVSGL